ncbi:flagellar biosynthesis protein FlhB [Blastomonas sp.]|uniref:EscU/YscU/HrcU family type III secretion system export apparatus switch protein n=1 Tax=Blastomonas sp. TaxID=1909299 RepID=UPI00262DD71A|nr:flagellar type III secretion system protein FlhB [Blastomonas sp.]MDM7955973.1 flagellar type III secretion system protein FlhB [Blastomonas sp.]
MADQPPGGGEKTEAPTEKRLRDSAEKGDVLQSKELGTAMIVIGGTLAFVLFGDVMVSAIAAMLRAGLVFDLHDATDFNVGQRTFTLLAPLMLPFGGLFLFLMLAAVATPASLGSLGFRWSALQPKASKLNPMAGFKRMFGMHGLIELGKSMAKVALMGTVGVVMIMSMLPQMAELGHGDVRAGIGAFGELFGITLMAMAGCLGLIAMIDVPAQWFQRNQKLKMTKQEVKDEHKETEGSPELKQAVRRRQFEMLNGSTRKAVEEATVILVNPTHFAIALRYDRLRDAAPVVLARGRGAIAQAMREMAMEKGVTILRYPELTRAIYFTSRPGAIVDERLYMAVATLLAFVFRINEKMDVGFGQPELVVPADMRFDMDGKPQK